MMKFKASLSTRALSVGFVFLVFTQSTFAFSLFHESLLEFGPRQKIGSLETRNPLRILVWNVQKIEDRKLYADYKMIVDNAPLVLFQEMVSSPHIVNPLVETNGSFEWGMVKTWKRQGGDYTGVATGSRIPPIEHLPIVSKVTEPISNTPKSALLSYFPLAGHPHSLLVVNVHAINFVTLATYVEYLKQVYAAIENHQGPMILAGDFNTWSNGRMRNVLGMAKRLGLTQVPLPDNRKTFDLDHVFVRGLKVSKVYDLHRIKTSDHVPLLMDLEFQPAKETKLASSF